WPSLWQTAQILFCIPDCLWKHRFHRLLRKSNLLYDHFSCQRSARIKDQPDLGKPEGNCQICLKSTPQYLSTGSIHPGRDVHSDLKTAPGIYLLKNFPLNARHITFQSHAEHSVHPDVTVFVRQLFQKM